MNDQSWNGGTNVIVNRRTAVFVTRDRAQGQPAYDNYHLFLRDKGKRIKDETENGAAPTIAARCKI
jgi:hypothetical protein